MAVSKKNIKLVTYYRYVPPKKSRAPPLVPPHLRIPGGSLVFTIWFLPNRIVANITESKKKSDLQGFLVFLYARGHTDSKWVNGWEISGQERFYLGGWVFTYFQCLLFVCADGWSGLFCTIWYSAIWHFFSINTYLLEIFLNSRIKRNYFWYINNNPFFLCLSLNFNSLQHSFCLNFCDIENMNIYSRIFRLFFFLMEENVLASKSKQLVMWLSKSC